MKIFLNGIVFENRVKNIKMTGLLKLFSAFLFIFLLAGCSKKVHPSQTPGITVITTESSETVVTTPEKVVVVEKKVAPPIPKTSKPVFPNSITVNDVAAKKSTDGRHYYDVKGHRYWKNYKDGKYYLYNKSMYNNPDFKNPDSK